MQPNAYDRALKALERYNDPELLEAYRRYVERLKTILTSEELDIYARAHQHPLSNVEAVNQQSPDQVANDPTEATHEINVTNKVAADSEAQALYTEYEAILGTRDVLTSDSSHELRSKAPQTDADT